MLAGRFIFNPSISQKLTSWGSAVRNSLMDLKPKLLAHSTNGFWAPPGCCDKKTFEVTLKPSVNLKGAGWPNELQKEEE